jgi:hypothetical protein
VRGDNEYTFSTVANNFLDSNKGSQTTLTVNFYGCSSRYEAELAVFVESVSSSSGTSRGLTYYLSHILFSETVYTVANQIQGPC